MKLILTPSNPQYTLALVDIETGRVTPIPTSPAETPAIPAQHHIFTRHRPFGITWSKDALYVANRTSILAFDRKLRYLGILGQSACQNPHQIVFRDGKLLVASPWADGISVLEDSGGPRLFRPHSATWETAPFQAGAEHDHHHYNSLLICGDKSYVLSHNKGLRPSQVLVFSYPDWKFLESLGPLGSCAHNLCKEPEGIVTLDTDGGGALIRSDGAEIQLAEERRWFLRGLAVTSGYYFVGVSCRTERIFRGRSACRILVVCRKKRRVVDSLQFEELGAINDLRVLDVFDEAHGAMPFLQYQEEQSEASGPLENST